MSAQTKHSDADTFRGAVLPGPARVLIRILPESEDYTIPGTGLKLWLPRPSSHDGFTGQIAVPCAPYYDPESGQEFKAIYPKDSIVVVGKFTGTMLTLNRDKYVVCKERDIVCRIIPEEDLPAHAEATTTP